MTINATTFIGTGCTALATAKNLLFYNRKLLFMLRSSPDSHFKSIKNREKSYIDGFGDEDNGYWIGLDNLVEATKG